MPVIGCYDGSGMGQSIEGHSIMDEYIGNSDEPSWFKFHRHWIEDSPVFANAEYFKIFVWLLSRARHKPGSVALKSGQVVSLKAGECIVGRKSGGRALDMSDSTFRNRLEKLAELGAITLKKDRSFTRVSIVFSLGCKPKKDRVRTTRGQPEDNLRTTRGQPEDTNKTNQTNQTNEMNHTDERESSGVAAFPPTIEQISSLIDEYIRTNYSNEKTRELEEQIATLRTEAETIKVATEGLRDEGKIEQGSKEWCDATGEYYSKQGQAESKQSLLRLEFAREGLSDVRKQNLAREFFNYWECEGWTERGKQIRLESQVNKWTQREISKKHGGSGSNDSKKKRVTLEVPPERHFR